MVKRFWHHLTKTWRGQTLGYGVGALLLALFLASFTLMQLNRTNDDLHTIDSDSIPSVDAAQQLEVSLQALAATSADYLSAAGLSDTFDCILPGQSSSVGQFTNHECDARAIPIYIEQIQGQLYQATRNVTYPGEKTAIRRIQTGLTLYLQDIAKMQENYELGKHPGAQQYSYLHQAYLDFSDAEKVLTSAISSDQPPVYEQDVPSCNLTLPGASQPLPANDWPRGSLQTEVRCLADINSTHLTAAYQDAQSFLQASSAQLILVTLALLLLLLFIMMRIIRLSRIGLHVFLLASFLLALVGSIQGISTLSALGGDTGAIQRAVISDRISIDAAASISDYTTAANADESYYLIAYNYNDQDAFAHWQLDWTQNIMQVGTSTHEGSGMYTAYHNITYPAERDAYAKMEQWLAQYDLEDQNIRDAIQHSNPQDPNRALPAQRISVGASDKAFNQFIAATQQLASIDRDDYQSTIASAFAQLQSAMWLAPLLLLLAGVSVLVGSLVFARQL